MPGWTGAPPIVPARIVWRTELGQQLPGERKARRRARKQPNAVTLERLWQGLTDPAFTRRYWQTELHMTGPWHRR